MQAASESNDLEAGNQREVAHIDSHQRIAVFERGSSYEQIGEGDGNASSALLAVDLVRQESGRFGVWNDF